MEIVIKVSTHSRAEAAAGYDLNWGKHSRVSTHSRAEAAAKSNSSYFSLFSFNTQPRGGGCSLPKKARKISVLNTVFR